ncbi:beta-ketoacyl synthase-like protein [Actinocorallia herbida]|uniref:Beta-ketoacyl synthase-like protein n=1 Tax=Actinocorallia herbida TaxID=58109 RepID=A0A3N1CU31_9ACTN|nr:hypothetical protein [Actinocorallia herbida]ROO84806.1 beta-ketoacyl synthase-like protein [Actinocorallia herbida]
MPATTPQAAASTRPNASSARRRARSQEPDLPATVALAAARTARATGLSARAPARSRSHHTSARSSRADLPNEASAAIAGASGKARGVRLCNRPSAASPARSVGPSASSASQVPRTAAGSSSQAALARSARSAGRGSPSPAQAALSRGARILAVAAGAGRSADGHDIVQPSAQGTGLAKAVTRCLADAGLRPDRIVAVNAHATGTPLGDVAEARGLETALGPAARALAVTATKSMTGHLLGGAGALGALVCVLALRDGLLPPVANLARQDREVALDLVSGEPRALPDGPAAVLADAVGFGGHNVVLAFARPD